jgi:hypothetical protein
MYKVASLYYMVLNADAIGKGYKRKEEATSPQIISAGKSVTEWISPNLTGSIAPDSSETKSLRREFAYIRRPVAERGKFANST